MPGFALSIDTPKIGEILGFIYVGNIIFVLKDCLGLGKVLPIVLKARTFMNSSVSYNSLKLLIAVKIISTVFFIYM